MSSLVIIPIAQRRKHLVTVWALERFFPRVESHVHLQVWLLDRGLGTEWAFKDYGNSMIQMLLPEVSFQPLIPRVCRSTSLLHTKVLSFRALEGPGEACRDPVVRDDGRAFHHSLSMVSYRLLGITPLARDGILKFHLILIPVTRARILWLYKVTL